MNLAENDTHFRFRELLLTSSFFFFNLSERPKEKQIKSFRDFGSPERFEENYCVSGLGEKEKRRRKEQQVAR